jgi:predicted transcriptional regulator
MQTSRAKDEVRQLLDTLPDDVSLQTIQYHLFIRLKLDSGLLAIEQGRTLSQEEVEERMARWLRPSGGPMVECPPRKLPEFSSLDEAARFGEENDLGDYLDGMPEGHFEVTLARRLRIDRELHRELDAHAHARGTTPEELANTWLREKLQTEKSSRS